MVKRVSRSRWVRVTFLTLVLSLAAVVLTGLGVGGGDQARAQTAQDVINGTAIGGKPGQSVLSKALFNHDKHQAAAKDNCDACHHTGTQDNCTSCHTSQGAPEGGNVQLSQAMHDPNAKMSCVGCHAQQTKKPECMGCHRDIVPGPKQTNCTVCHKDPKAAPAPAPAAPAQPDTVDIGSISKKYGPCTFNHSSHVEALKSYAKGDLAKAFHANDAALCAGCHHHTPVGQTPPKCGTCHGKAFEDANRPGLMAAYHIQCNQCHKAMGVEPVPAADCKGCHAPKN